MGRLVPTVLVADDDDDVREAVADVVLRAGCDVALARHGSGARCGVIKPPKIDIVAYLGDDHASAQMLDISKTSTLIMHRPLRLRFSGTVRSQHLLRTVMGLVEVTRRRGSGVR